MSADEAAGPLRDCGLSVTDLRVSNPAIIVPSITDFGTTGPWADRPANELAPQASGGSTITSARAGR